MGASPALLAALLLQGGGDPLLERLADPAWMLLAPAEGETVEQRDWAAADAERSWTLDGAGVVAALWADPPAGRLLFFRPGADEPVLAWDLASLAAGAAGFPAPLAERVGSGWSCTVPVAFRDGLRIEHQPDPRVPSTLAVTVRRLPSADGLPALEEARATPARVRALARVAARLASGGFVPAEVSGFKAGAVAKPVAEAFDAVPGSGDFQWGFRGHGVVRWITLRFLDEDLPRPAEELLRGIVLRVEVGSHERMTAGRLLFEVPLADFLGSGLRPRAACGAWCDWDEATRSFRFRLPMPYRDGMKLILRSPWAEPVPVRLDAGVDAVEDPADLPPLALHAGFVAGVGGAVPELEVDGPARLAGWTLTAEGPPAEAVGADGGDARERDGRFEAVPRYAGASAFALAADRPRPARFRALCVDELPGAAGMETLVRCYALDAPSGSDGLRFRPGADFAAGTRWGALAWWYAAPGAAARWGGGDAPAAARAPLSAGAPEARMPRAVAGDGPVVLEIERLAVATMTTGTREEARADPAAGGGRWLWWSGGEDARLNLLFPVERPGSYRVYARAAPGAGLGRVQLLVDGRPLGEPLAPGAEGEVLLGTLRLLPRRDHTLTLRPLDGAPVGLDSLRLEPVPAGGADDAR